MSYMFFFSNIYLYSYIKNIIAVTTVSRHNFIQLFAKECLAVQLICMVKAIMLKS